MHGITCDDAGNTYATGEFEETSVFGLDTIIATGDNDIFLIKYDTYGNQKWIRKVGGSVDSDAGNGVAVFENNIYLNRVF